MSFRPARWLPNRHLMTMVASVARLPVRLPVRRERWELPDGDFLDVDRMPGARGTLVVLHGLESSSRAGYVRGLLAEARRHGLGAVALNFRGCTGPNRLSRFYHSGDTGDLAHAIERLAPEGRPIVLAGFSLGGNVIVKYLGERGDAVPEAVRAAAVVSVPFDLRRCAEALDAPGMAAWIYRERFLRPLKLKAADKAARFPGCIDAERAQQARTLREFDDAVTARLHGFRDALDYWERSSSGPYVAKVRRPLLILASQDDPFVPADSIPVEAARANPDVTLEIFAEGGHVAFVAGAPWSPLRWAEWRMAEFLRGEV
jgi:predicted alpha/beta-fold hydrolase